MRPRSSPPLWALVAAALLVACESPPSTSEPPAIPLDARGDYHHELTGLAFPTAIGPYLRTELVAHGSDRRSISGRYALRGDPAAIAILQLYPATADASFPVWDDLDAEFDSGQTEIEQLEEGGELMSDFVGDATVNGFSLRGRQAVYRVDVEGDADEPAIASFHLYAIENWYLKFHFRHPERETSELSRLERAFIGSIRWPLPGDRPRPEPTPACIELADRYEGVARLQDRGLSREEQIARVEEEVDDAAEDRFLLVVLLNAVSVSEAYPERTSFQIRKLVLEDCVEGENGRAELPTLWPWLDADEGPDPGR